MIVSIQCKSAIRTDYLHYFMMHSNECGSFSCISSSLGFFQKACELATQSLLYIKGTHHVLMEGSTG
jgi:hypothetical protein